MIATKPLLLIVIGLAGRENNGKTKNCLVLARVVARYIGILNQMQLNDLLTELMPMICKCSLVWKGPGEGKGP